MPTRLPDEYRNVVAFLGSRDSEGTITYRGTAFVTGFPVDGRSDLYHTYLVTSAHSIRRAQNAHADLVVRFNTIDGGSTVERLTTDWIFHSDEAIDLAVLPLELPANHDMGLIPVETFATDELLAQHDVGIGDEVIAIGLFFFRHGRDRNRPVLRTGIIASMPEEPFIDEQSGQLYDAYLVEMRSFGGLSGTPVFTVIHHGSLHNSPGRVFSPLVHQLALVGVVRGHWTATPTRRDHGDNDLENANIGLAIVTPAQLLSELLMRDDLARARRREEATLPATDTAETGSA